MNVQIETIVVGAFQVNCYVVWGQDKRATLIDPGADADIIRQVLAEKSLVPAAYFLTHGHIDHISALGTLLAEHPAPVALHPEDEKWAFSAANTMPPCYHEMVAAPARAVVSIDDAARVDIAGGRARVIHTPGHTPGGISLYADGHAFVGDTLFQGSIGRTDFPGGDHSALISSIREKLFGLGDDVRVFTGHGAETVTGTEKRYNPFAGTGES